MQENWCSRSEGFIIKQQQCLNTSLNTPRVIQLQSGNTGKRICEDLPHSITEFPANLDEEKFALGRHRAASAQFQHWTFKPFHHPLPGSTFSPNQVVFPLWTLRNNLPVSLSGSRPLKLIYKQNFGNPPLPLPKLYAVTALALLPSTLAWLDHLCHSLTDAPPIEKISSSPDVISAPHCSDLQLEFLSKPRPRNFELQINSVYLSK